MVDIHELAQPSEGGNVLRRHRKICSVMVVSVLLVAGAAISHAAPPIRVQGSVTMEDGTPVAGASVRVHTVSSEKSVAQRKTKKNGTFSLIFFPLTLEGVFTFVVEKDDLLMKHITVQLLDEDRNVGAEFDFKIGPLQELQEFEISTGRTAIVDITMVPRSYYAGFLVIPGDKTNTDRLARANKHSREGQFAESIALLQQILDDGVSNANIYFLMGRNAFSLNQAEEGTRWFTKTLELNGDMAGVHGQLGVAAHERGDDEEALREFDLELKIAPTVELEINRASVLIELERREEAIAAFEGIIERYPDQTPAYAELAVLHLQGGENEQAAEILEKMEQTGKPDPSLWFNIGANFSNRKEYGEAEKAYHRALALDPSFADAVRELGFLQIGTDNPEGALEYLQKYLEIRPDAEDAGRIRVIVEALTARIGG